MKSGIKVTKSNARRPVVACYRAQSDRCRSMCFLYPGNFRNGKEEKGIPPVKFKPRSTEQIFFYKVGCYLVSRVSFRPSRLPSVFIFLLLSV